MAEGRDGAVVAMAVLGLLMMSLQCDVAQAASYTVGDEKGWAMNVNGWEQGKTFKAKDTLVFNYTKGAHNVVVTTKAGYDACKAAPSDKVYITGKDQITIAKGDNYFICTLPNHCASMKIKVTAS
ncbi:basic blue protein-like [Bidens hawaiensis]|uniref:basic blue protein-like n=1 Tax=Bidens hawaiensis TaxID=980011 RepID=UPI0040495074